jgi:hypothetical protein
MADDEDIEEVYEKKTLLRKQKMPPKSTMYSCCRVCMILTAMVIFVLMLIQLWSNYGEYIENKVMAPSIAGAGEFDKDGAHTQFVMKYHKWENGSLHLNMTKPTSYMVLTSPIYPITWVEECMQVEMEDGTVKVFVYSM